jgi:hypothetical protein
MVQSRSRHLCGLVLHACSLGALARSVDGVSRRENVVRNVYSPLGSIRIGFRSFGLVNR